jgi:hypothetical protein
VNLLLEQCSANELLEMLKMRCEEEFTADSPFEPEKKIELHALRDCLVENPSFLQPLPPQQKPETFETTSTAAHSSSSASEEVPKPGKFEQQILKKNS